MSSREVIKSVAKQLKYYMDVQRREDGFDLSDSNTPRLDHPPLKPHPTLQYSQKQYRPLKHYYSLPEVKQTQMRQKEQSGRSREKDVKHKLKVYMANTEYITTTLPEYYYVQTRHGKRLIPEAIPFRGPAKVKRKKTIKGGWPILRTVPPHDVSRAEATRLVNVAAKLLIATETLEKENSEWRSKSPTTARRTSRQQGAPRSFESNRSASDDRRSSLQHGRDSRLSTGKRRQRPLTASLTRQRPLTASLTYDIQRPLTASQRPLTASLRPLTASLTYDIQRPLTASLTYDIQRPLTASLRPLTASLRPLTASLTYDIHARGQRPLTASLTYDIHASQRPLTASLTYDIQRPLTASLTYDIRRQRPLTASLTYDIHRGQRPLTASLTYDIQRPLTASLTYDIHKRGQRPLTASLTYDIQRPLTASLTYDIQRPLTASLTYDIQRPLTASLTYDIQRPLTASLTYDIHASKGKGFSDSYDSAYNTESPKGGSHWTRHERRNEDSSSSVSSDSKRPQKKMSPNSRPYSARLPRTRPDSSKYKVQHTGPNILSPEPGICDDVVINEGTQTQDSVGIQTEKRLLDNFDPLDVEVLQGEVIEYEVNVRTGTRVGASTNADVKLTIYGEKGRTKEFPLLNSTRHKVKFQKGKEDQFYISVPHVGKLRKVKIGHDRTDLNYAWFLEGVTVSDTYDRRVYEFPCERWLSGQDGDKRTYRELYLDRERGMIDEDDTDYELSEPDIPTTKQDNNDIESDTKKRFIIEKPEESYSDNDSESVQVQHSQRKSDSEETETESESDSDSSSYKHRNKNIVPVASDSERSQSINESPKTEEERTPAERQSPVGQQNDEPYGTTRKDDFFDQRPARPSYTFLASSDVNSNKPEYSESEKQALSTAESVIDSGYLAGYKAGIETSLNDSKPERDDEAMNVLQGQTIHEAAKVGNLERMQLLSLHYPKLKESSNEIGWTALHVATAHGQTEVVKWLSGAIVELNKETPTGFTAIHIAAQNGHVSCMMVLFAMGASITCRTIDSQTPLHLAASRGYLECVKWLVANRANLDALDSFGRNPRNMAEEFKEDDVAAFLHSCQKEFANPNSTFHQLQSPDKSFDPSPTVDQSYEEAPIWIDRKATESRSSVSQHATAGSDDESDTESEKTSSQPDPDLQEKKKMYDEQQSMMEKTGTSFLDSIRQEMEETS